MANWRPWRHVRRQEWPLLGLGFAWFFLVLFGYYLVRPLRETFAAELGTERTAPLFTVVFTVLLCITPLYGALASRSSRRVTVMVVYGLVGILLLVFAGLLQWQSLDAWIKPAFFVFVSVYNFFVVSIFWSFMADIFTAEQAKRLFGLIMAGGTLGGLFSSQVAARGVHHWGQAALVMMAGGAMLLTLGLMVAIDRLALQRAQRESATPAQKDAAIKPIGGGLLGSVTRVVASPYLLGICSLILMQNVCATTAYFQQNEVVRSTLSDKNDRTAFFGEINFWTQLVAVLLQWIVSGPLMRYVGLPVAMSILPLLYLGGFLYFLRSPTLSTIGFLQVLLRAVGFGVAQPAQETLFTVVSREEKYKAKNFIDTVITRGSDALTATLNQRLPALWLAVSIPFLAIVWVGCSWVVGRTQQARQRQTPQETA